MNKRINFFVYGSEKIGFDVIYAKRKTMEIAVLPDRQVVIRAPLGTDLIEIQKRVKKRARWINRQISHFNQFEPRTQPRQYVSGETHLYLGRQYRLKIMKGDKDEVKLMKGRLFVILQKARQPEMVKDCLEDWYRRKAWEKFPDIFESCLVRFQRIGLERPVLKIKKMKSRWGSLSKQQTLTLNLKLIHAPGDCIEYVIIHELCHLKYHDHSSDFYKLMERFLPDWEKRKRRLEFVLL